ncbi:folylpolyglutamate synthase/dihydrofolate synthase family protein [Clostridium sediminicola]|uniref:bifunctional folylpolyglutamate synthase/dihydrofolate synthase n=1 Tax=Clostridium sediminicola TaxID=3114879 RepID=UPI0031F27107
MDYNESIKYISESSRFSINLGLERTEKMLELLGNPQHKVKCIHVAGTNGKGSTSAMICQILMEQGYKTGLYTSPYIEVFEERIQINRENITKEKFAQLVTKVSLAVEELKKLDFEPPTQFEIITAAAFLYFFENNVDFVVLEVGLGGRLDATNVITPILSIITSISYDHINILGDTIEKIAYEKAGIIKNNVPVILYPQYPEAYKTIRNICKERSSKLVEVNVKESSFLKAIINDNFVGQEIKIKTHFDSYDIKLSLLGKHQIFNCVTAITAIEELIRLGVVIKKENIISALYKVKWMVRLEVLKKKPLVVIDGAHNKDGIKMLLESIEEYFDYNKLNLILGILADKEIEEMVELIANKAQKIICVTPNNDRAELAKNLEKMVYKFNTNCCSEDNYLKAYEKAIKNCNEDDLLLVCGSLYMVGDMRKYII